MPSRNENELKTKIEKMKLLILDVDGVLTDGHIVYDSDGRELKFFDAQDGVGILMLLDVGIKTIWVTIKPSKAIARRAQELKIVKCYEGVRPKTKILEEVLKEHTVTLEEICYVGDDLIDLGMMKAVGFPVAVANASQEIKDVAVYVTEKTGGRGAVREITDLILKLKGQWEGVLSGRFGQ